MVEEKEDTAGQMIGGAIGSGMKKKPLDDLVDFPCDFTFKIIGMVSDDFVSKIVNGITAHGGKPLKIVSSECKKSSKNKYTSLTLVLNVQESQDIYDVYEACQAMPEIKFVL
jgi:putative lipoic acid-binding regulatory protein